MAKNFLLLTKAHQFTYAESIMEPKEDKCMEKHIYTYCGKSAENQEKGIISQDNFGRSSKNMDIRFLSRNNWAQRGIKLDAH